MRCTTHKFKIIYSRYTDCGLWDVVRWCIRCGGVGVDATFDSKVTSKTINNMQYPTLEKNDK